MPKRVDWDTYFMGIAEAVRERSGCCRRQFGAIIVGSDRGLVSSGYNGTPAGVTNCDEGGCERCNADDVEKGYGYDVCLCEHAERNAIYYSREPRMEHCTLYVTGRPCMECMRAIVSKHISMVVYREDDFSYAPRWEDQYKKLVKEGRVTLRAIP